MNQGASNTILKSVLLHHTSEVVIRVKEIYLHSSVDGEHKCKGTTVSTLVAIEGLGIGFVRLEKRNLEQ